MRRHSPTSITQPRGFRAAGGTCGIKPSGKPDLALIVSDVPCATAAVFTTNKVKGAPVLVSQKHVRNGKARAIVCNSGTSNVATGEQGLRDAEAMCQTTAAALGLRYASEVLVASTGVIGHRLPMDKVLPGIEQLAPTLAQGKKADNAAADAILTTDLVRKTALRTVTLGGKTVTLGGIAEVTTVQGRLDPSDRQSIKGEYVDTFAIDAPTSRSEERRVGKEGRSRWSPDH